LNEDRTADGQTDMTKLKLFFVILRTRLKTKPYLREVEAVGTLSGDSVLKPDRH